MCFGCLKICFVPFEFIESAYDVLNVFLLENMFYVIWESTSILYSFSWFCRTKLYDYLELRSIDMDSRHKYGMAQTQHMSIFKI